MKKKFFLVVLCLFLLVGINFADTTSTVTTQTETEWVDKVQSTLAKIDCEQSKEAVNQALLLIENRPTKEDGATGIFSWLNALFLFVGGVVTFLVTTFRKPKESKQGA